MAKMDIIEQLIDFEKREATGAPHYRMLITHLKQRYNLNWEEIKNQYLKN